MDTIKYEGYEIMAKPNQLVDGSWQTNLSITNHLGSRTISKGFSSGNSFLRREEAVENCFEFGRQIINENVAGCSVGIQK